MIVYRAAWVVPIAAPPIADGAVAVDDTGRLAFVGSSRTAPAGSVRDLGNAVLLPGLINTHTHLELTVMRGFLETTSFFDWIMRLTTARREVLTEEDLAHSARIGLCEGIESGITTYADTSQSGVTLRVMKELGVRGIMYLETFGPDAAERDAALAAMHGVLARVREDETDISRLGISPHAPYSVSSELFRAVGDLARSSSLPIAIHVAESADESHFVRSGTGPWADSHRRRGINVVARGLSPIAYLETTGVLAARPLLVHCVQADHTDISLIATRDCAVAHCPISNAKLGHGVAPLGALLAAGVRTGLGSDSMASNNRMHLLEEARAAVLAQRSMHGASALDAHQALTLATVGGARALGIEDRTGTLEQGKDADLAAFPLDELSSTPASDVTSALVYSLGAARARLVTVRGRELVADGRLLTDVAASVARVRDTAGRLERWRASRH